MTYQDLYEAYLQCRKHNRKSTDQVEFELNYPSKLANLLKELNDRTYKPKYNYCFIHYRPKAREVFAAEVKLKIIQTYVDIRIRSLIEGELIDRTYNNIKGRGIHAAVERVFNDIKEVSEDYTEDCYIIKLDFLGFFPHMNQHIAFDKVKTLIYEKYNGDDLDDLMYCVQVSCFCNPQFNSEKRFKPHEEGIIPEYKTLFSKPWGIGGAIGYLFWQIMSNFYLSDIDHFIVKNVCPNYVRFVDDCVFVTKDKEFVLSQIPILRNKLAEINIFFHPRKFYCQHYSHGVEFLGYRLKNGRIYINTKTIERAFKLASYQKKGTKYFVSAINSYLGMMKKYTEYKNCVKILDAIKCKNIAKDYENFKITLIC